MKAGSLDHPIEEGPIDTGSGWVWVCLTCGRPIHWRQSRSRLGKKGWQHSPRARHDIPHGMLDSRPGSCDDDAATATPRSPTRAE